MRAKTVKAVPEMVGTARALEDLEESLDDEAITAWKELLAKWEENAANQNPFEALQKDDHLATVRRELAQEAAAREAAGEEEEGDVQEEMHVTEFLAMGLQLEEQQ